MNSTLPSGGTTTPSTADCTSWVVGPDLGGVAFFGPRRSVTVRPGTVRRVRAVRDGAEFELELDAECADVRALLRLPRQGAGLQALLRDPAFGVVVGFPPEHASDLLPRCGEDAGRQQRGARTGRRDRAGATVDGQLPVGRVDLHQFELHAGRPTAGDVGDRVEVFLRLNRVDLG